MNRATLCAEWRSGSRPSFLMFWGHRPNADGRIGASCLSQWWLTTFSADGEVYKSAEHWMMANKAHLFDDREAETKILGSSSPRDAKALGRSVRGFVPEVWDQKRFALVVEGNRHKFSQDERLREYLLSTGDDVLVEASPVDSVWGIGLAADALEARDPTLWRGENLLGFALMEVRTTLRS